MAKRNRRVGYGLPVVLAIAVHVVALLMTMLRLPDSEPTPSSSSVVQATLVSDVTATDQAQYAQEARARTAQRQAEEAAQGGPRSHDRRHGKCHHDSGHDVAHY